MPLLKRKMPLFDVLAASGTAAIHACGAAATERLLDCLAPTSTDTILDIGCGGGHTLALIRARFGCTVVGVDANERMLEGSKRRLRFCGLSEGVTLVRADVTDALPFPDSHFDKIYCESVLGFQPVEQRLRALHEIRRVLKPGGRFVANETLWLAETTDEEIAQWNKKCLAYFGMIQAAPDLKGPDRLKTLLADVGFDDRSFRAQMLSAAEERERETRPRTAPGSGEAPHMAGWQAGEAFRMARGRVGGALRMARGRVGEALRMAGWQAGEAFRMARGRVGGALRMSRGRVGEANQMAGRQADARSHKRAGGNGSDRVMRRSVMFSRYRLVKSCLHPVLLRERVTLRRRQREMRDFPQIMQGWLITIENG